jgi:hypothetical protein
VGCSTARWSQHGCRRDEAGSGWEVALRVVRGAGQEPQRPSSSASALCSAVFAVPIPPWGRERAERQFGRLVLLLLRGKGAFWPSREGGNVGNVLVLYDSRTGNAAKMADCVGRGAGEAGGTEVWLLSVDEAHVDDVFWCDGLAVGSPTHVGVASWRMKRFWDEVVPRAWGKAGGKIACAFPPRAGGAAVRS